MRCPWILSIFLALGNTFPLKPRNSPLELVTAENLLTIAPTSNSCEDAQYREECRTSDWAAKAMSISYKDFGSTSPGELAALVSLIVYESGEFMYNHKHFPPTPGSGTRNMQSIEFNLEYASVFPSLADDLNKITGGQQSLSDEQKDQVVQLLNDHDTDFGSAAWYLKTKCPEVSTQLASSFSTSVWETYVTQCVGGTMDDKRREYFDKAAKVLFGL